MFRKVVIVTNLSDESVSLLRRLHGLKILGVESCVLLLCLGTQEAASLGLSYAADRLEQNLDSQKSILTSQGFSVEARAVYGDAVDEINRAAREDQCSAIVVGARTSSMIGELLFGGIADNVIHHAQKPVLVVRVAKDPKDKSGLADAIENDLSSHVLFPTDFSDNANLAFDYVRTMALRGTKKVTLVHIQDRVRISPHLDDRLDEFNVVDQERLERMKKVIQEQSETEVDIAVAYGSPVVEIIKLVEERDVKLVVMGNQGRGFVQELFLGSVSNNIARLSPSSVMLVPMNR
jgi:nucleotide-binding universal stress UspA family protein